MKKLFSFLIPIIIAVCAVIITNSFLDNQLKKLSQEKNLKQFSSKYGDYTKDRSVVAKDIAGNNGDLFLMGSSEMAIHVPQNSLKLFPIKGAEYNVYSYGRGCVQSLQQASCLGGCNLDKNQKIGYIISIQWFDSLDGVTADSFAGNFSDIQFYNFLNNPKISNENKKYYAQRIYDLLTKAGKYDAEAFYAKLYLNDNLLSKAERMLFYPYYKVNAYLSRIKDKALIYKELIALPSKDSNNTDLQDIDWNNEYEKAEQKSEASESTNQFYLNDKYYAKNVEKDIDYVHGLLSSQNPIESKEMSDLKFYLSVCHDLKLKPYIILPPVNGWYYDYMGLSKDKRYEYYDTVKELAKENGLDVLDLRKYEYKKDFLIDTMHLGEEGWLKVSESIYNEFDQK